MTCSVGKSGGEVTFVYNMLPIMTCARRRVTCPPANVSVGKSRITILIHSLAWPTGRQGQCVPSSAALALPLLIVLHGVAPLPVSACEVRWGVGVWHALHGWIAPPRTVAAGEPLRACQVWGRLARRAESPGTRRRRRLTDRPGRGRTARGGEQTLTPAGDTDGPRTGTASWGSAGGMWLPFSGSRVPHALAGRPGRCPHWRTGPGPWRGTVRPRARSGQRLPPRRRASVVPIPRRSCPEREGWIPFSIPAGSPTDAHSR